MGILQAIKIARDAIKADKETTRKRADFAALKATPLNYGIIQELVTAAWNFGRAVKVSVRLADSTVLEFTPMDGFDAKKASEEIMRAYWEGGDA